MDLNSENLKYIFGIKLKKLRQDKGYSLKELSNLTHMSQSYLNEIEKGKKYPKAEKILDISKALEIPFDELVTFNFGNELSGIANIIDILSKQEFPFELFGITVRDIIDIMSDSPNKANALLSTFMSILRTYDMRVEHFFFAALRSYQEMHSNYFPKLEEEAMNFRNENNITEIIPDVQKIKDILINKYNYKIEETDFSEYPELENMRSVWIKGTKPSIFINNKLSDQQKCFLLCRELGYQYLNLKERSTTSTWIKVESFEQVLNNFKASYFAGALLIHKDELVKDLKDIYSKKKWTGKNFLKLIEKYNSTPETFMHRLSEILPHAFNLKGLHFLRFSHKRGTDHYELTKELNMSNIIIPHGIGLNEHYCNRWLSVSLLKELEENQNKSNNNSSVINAQVSKFIPNNNEFFCITIACPMALSESTNISLTLGCNLNEDFKNIVQYWDDKKVLYRVINETCERCHLKPEECKDRTAPPSVYQKEQNILNRNNSLNKFISEMKN